MFEETELMQNSIHPDRKKACLSQCRVANFAIGKTLLDGNCPCDSPSECKMGLSRLVDEEFRNDFFTDVREYYKALAWE